MAREHLLVVGWRRGGGIEKSSGTSQITITTPLVAPFDVSDAFVAD